MKQQFEWIYTQFVSDNVFLNIILHRTDMFGKSLSSYLSISYYTKDGNRAHQRFPISLEDVFRNDNSNEIFIVDIKKDDIKIVGQINIKHTNEINQNR